MMGKGKRELAAWDYGDETEGARSEAWYCMEAARAAIEKARGGA